MASNTDELDRFIELLKQLQPCPSFEPHFNAFRVLLISYGFTSEVSLTDYASFETMFEETDFKAFIVGLGKLWKGFQWVLKATTIKYSKSSSSSSSSGSGSASGSDGKKISANKKKSTYTPWEKLKAALKFLRPEGLEDGGTWSISRGAIILPTAENCPVELQNEVNGYAVGKVISNVKNQRTFKEKHDDIRQMGLNLDANPKTTSKSNEEGNVDVDTTEKKRKRKETKGKTEIETLGDGVKSNSSASSSSSSSLSPATNDSTQKQLNKEFGIRSESGIGIGIRQYGGIGSDSSSSSMAATISEADVPACVEKGANFSLIGQRIRRFFLGGIGWFDGKVSEINA